MRRNEQVSSELTSSKEKPSKQTMYEIRKANEVSDETFEKRLKEAKEKGVIPTRKILTHGIVATGNNERYTPPYIIEKARKVMGAINTDPASNAVAQKYIKADRWFSKEDDGLSKKWEDNVWLNPPYSTSLLTKFVDKLVSEKDRYTQLIMLVHNATESLWAQKLFKHCMALCFVKGRINFLDEEGKELGGNPMQGSMILAFGHVDKEKFRKEFGEMGRLMEPMCSE